MSILNSIGEYKLCSLRALALSSVAENRRCFGPQLSFLGRSSTSDQKNLFERNTPLHLKSSFNNLVMKILDIRCSQ